MSNELIMDCLRKELQLHGVINLSVYLSVFHKPITEKVVPKNLFFLRVLSHLHTQSLGGLLGKTLWPSMRDSSASFLYT